MRELALIKSVVAEHYGIEPRLLERKHGARRHARPRELACYLASHMFDFSYGEIGLAFGNREQSAVRALIKKTEKKLSSAASTAMAEEIAKLTLEIERKLPSIPGAGDSQITARINALSLLIETARTELTELQRLIIRERTSCTNFSTASSSEPRDPSGNNGAGSAPLMDRNPVREGGVHE